MHPQTYHIIESWVSPLTHLKMSLVGDFRDFGVLLWCKCYFRFFHHEENEILLKFQ